MGSVRILVAYDQCAKFRKAKPLRHLTLEYTAFPVAARTLARDDQDEARAPRYGNAQKPQQRRMGFALRQSVQIEPTIDRLPAPRDPRLHTAA
jgi:hypothetical protein